VKDMTTDQIMQAIQSGNDIGKLQMLARGLLAERNDWRFRSMQAERGSLAKEQQLAEVQKQLAAANEKCHMLQLQVSQLTESDLINELVKAKVEFAQSEESAITLRGQLMKSQERGRQLAAKLTKLESDYARLLHEHWVAQQAEGQGWPAGAPEK
jgi:chromosome segregation ATPase